MSKNPGCETGRRVTLIRRHHGKQGHDRTNGKGEYSIHEKNANGRYFTEIKSSTFFTPGGRQVICSGDHSPTIKV
jgi:hypothetical protein